MQMRRRFINIESNHMLAASTMLVKKLAFADVAAAEQCVRWLTGEMTARESSNTEVHSLRAQTVEMELVMDCGMHLIGRFPK